MVRYSLYWRNGPFIKSGLPSGFKSIKQARLSASKYLKGSYSIEIIKDNNVLDAIEIIQLFKGNPYALKTIESGKKKLIVRIAILKDGSLSKKKPTQADIIGKKRSGVWGNLLDELPGALLGGLF